MPSMLHKLRGGHRYGLLIIAGDVEPQRIRWFQSEEARDRAAKRYHRQHGDKDGVFMIEAHALGDLIRDDLIRVLVASYSGAFFDEYEH